MAQNSASNDSSSPRASLWGITALMGCLLCLLIAGLFSAARLVRSLQFSSATDKHTIRTPIGDFRMQKPGQVGPGLPLYPGSALLLPNGKALAHVSPADHELEQTLTATYHSNDPQSSVVNWYAEHLDSEFVRSPAELAAFTDVFRLLQIEPGAITFLGKRGDQQRLVALQSDPSGTTIFLVRRGK